MYETNDDLVLNFEPPGVREKDISLSITGDVLTVKGERQFNQQLNDDKYFHTERAYGKFERSIRLPMPVQAGRVRATYRDGMLESKPSGGRGGQAEGNQDRRFVGRSREMRQTVTVAGDARKVGGRPAVGRLPVDCPYCQEMLQDAPRGWVCRRCRSTVGAEPKANLIEEGL